MCRYRHLTIEEIWPLTDDEAAERIVFFLRDLKIKKKTGGTGGKILIPLIQELLSDTGGYSQESLSDHGEDFSGEWDPNGRDFGAGDA